MKTVGRELARLDRLIEEGRARTIAYRANGERAEHRASRRLEKDPPQIPRDPAPMPNPPPTPPSFPSLSSAMAAFVVASARKAKGEDDDGVEPGDVQPGNPPDPAHGDGEDDDQEGPEKPGDLILNAIKRRGK